MGGKGEDAPIASIRPPCSEPGSRYPQADPRCGRRLAATNASSLHHVARRFVEDALSSPSTKCEEAPFAAINFPRACQWRRQNRFFAAATRAASACHQAYSRFRLTRSSERAWLVLIAGLVAERATGGIALSRLAASLTAAWSSWRLTEPASSDVEGCCSAPPGLWSGGGLAIGSAGGEALFGRRRRPLFRGLLVSDP